MTQNAPGKNPRRGLGSENRKSSGRDSYTVSFQPLQQSRPIRPGELCAPSSVRRGIAEQRLGENCSRIWIHGPRYYHSLLDHISDRFGITAQIDQLAETFVRQLPEKIDLTSASSS